MPHLARWIVILVLVLAIVAFVIALAALWSRRAEKKRLAASRNLADGDRTAYDRILVEMMAHAEKSAVVCHEEAFSEPVLMYMRTVVDRFGQRYYIEKQRKFDQALHCTMCLYENGCWIPSKSIVINIPATQVDWSAFHRKIRDIRAHGAKISFKDDEGLTRQERVRCEPVELRV